MKSGVCTCKQTREWKKLNSLFCYHNIIIGWVMWKLALIPRLLKLLVIMEKCSFQFGLDEHPYVDSCYVQIPSCKSVHNRLLITFIFNSKFLIASMNSERTKDN